MDQSDRPSRQDLVVPPKQSSLPMILGACACACAGFGLVWALGIGRSGPRPADPELFAPADGETAQIGTGDGWRSPAIDPEEQPETDRYPNKPVSLDVLDPADAVVPASGEARPLSRFSSAASEAEPPAVLPADEPADSSDVDAEPPQAATDIDPPADEPTEEPAVAAVKTTPPSSPPQTLPEDDDADDVAAASEQPQAALPPAAEPTAAQPSAPSAFAAAPAAAVPAPASTATPSPVAHDALRNTAATGPVTPPAQPFLAAGVPPQVAAVAPPVASPPVNNGFSATPFTGPLQSASPPPSAPAGSGMTGQGRPGPMPLEGVQTPQLSMEKRGPREVQVGKPARYETIVRNVGTAVAHDVTLRDAVPAGTTLITTTPPATPGSGADANGSSGELVWLLGSVPPGGQVKVAMEVMPEAEGEIGSVASVTFRADATARSRATKPAIQLDAATPEPVLIGKDIRVAIKVSNPGTGVATGVVLEGTLPEGVAHRAGRELEFDVGQLKPGETRTIDLSLTTSGPGVHAMTLTARADGQLEVEHDVRLEVTAPMLELAVEMPARRYLQRPATCLITMANTGTAPAESVELATQLPPGLKFVRANNSGYYDERTHRVLWSLEQLPAGETGTVELVVMPVTLGPQKLVSAARNPAGLSDQVASTIEVDGLAALSFEVTDSEDPIEVDGLTEYVIRVGNQGTKAASGVRVSATLLGEMEPVEAKGPAAHRVENLTVLFEPLARIAPTEEAVFRIRVRGRRAGDQRVQVQITSDDHPAPITKEEITRVYADR